MTFSPELKASLAPLRPSDFKVIICFFAFGGRDSHNELVPRSGNNLSRYNEARPGGLRIEQSELLSLNGNSAWGLHPNMGYFRDQWNANRLAVLRHVGILNEPATRTQLREQPSRYEPQFLGAHDAQWEQWQDGLEFRSVARTTGWMGRLASLLEGVWNVPTAAADNDLMLSCVSIGGLSRQQRAFPPDGSVALPVEARPGAFGYGSSQATRLRELFTEAEGAGLPAAVDANRIRQGWKRQAQKNLAAPGFIQGQLRALPQAVSDALAPAPQLRPIAQAIYTAQQNQALGIRRLVAFVPIGGWDHHANLRPQHDPLILGLNNSMAAMAAAINAMGLTNSAVLCTQSEFGRTFRGNSNAGTDHAWAGHQFVMGGPVIGGMYGPEPNYAPTGEHVADDSGNIFIPQISTDQYYATLLRWFGLPVDAINAVLPGASRFTPQTLNFVP